MIWYFATRYLINGNNKLYKSKLFTLKREAEEQERLFLNNPNTLILIVNVLKYSVPVTLVLMKKTVLKKFFMN